ncbi:hydrogenase maturation protease [Mycobacterium intracellulare]|uniref:Hydrogenase maturation protease n=1 Tax=Mycobacterium intracellulare subsp. chimaera TaxID=222805 RepID=A0A7U5MKK4_MYCIT|nr:hydrogenase maturation protease [Mycobacterium intracellulare]ASL15141.1 hydrogenase maturation protease [Mycobacterium intracellulare subsp. chimaera]ASQ86330.1 peptidase M52 [Mycobacterium intracellulare subsp. chimaera]MCF1811669.1 hydrogenase maturation protease [Mycobacterium intracellulare subsp. intracellulare]MDM3926260.1 hydrogenase maturation protease [Mycobacterium intracellulare subsp. chimaera]MDS0333220.1 hydrogenase maturation protease [Mycobacterium intracellulare]
MTGASSGIVIIGVGNDYRRDDGVGVAAAAALDALALPNVVVKTGIADPMSLLEAWTGAGLAVLIDAATVNPSNPGCVRRTVLSDLTPQPEGVSSHSVDIHRTHMLGRALARVPRELVVFTVEAFDTGHGIGLSPQVASAVPKVVSLVAAEIDRARSSRSTTSRY